MSFNAKNLHYDRNEPAFLRKLRSQYGTGVGERHNAPANRPATAKRLLIDHEEDEPTYVDENGKDVVSKEEYESMLRGEAGSTGDADVTKASGDGDGVEGQGRDKQVPSDAHTDEAARGRSDRPAAEIGSHKRRKGAKVIAASEDDDGDEDRNSSKVASSTPPTARPAPHQAATANKKGRTRKAKKIKLQYDAEEGDD
ncbi:hypothetical protein KEM52_005451 [Ascosphaera acerosa]|nr:hypothetical protein KEM52_005451 [Ascosphaera acerosa]